MENYNELDPQEKTKIPQFLRIIGILTLINLGIAGLNAVAGLFSGPVPLETIDALMADGMAQVNLIREQGFNNMADAMERVVRFPTYANAQPYLMNTYQLLLVILGVSGVTLMFQGKRLGFHLYIVSCLIKLGTFYSCAPLSEVPTILVMYYLFTSILFIFMYARNLGYMKK